MTTEQKQLREKAIAHIEARCKPIGNLHSVAGYKCGGSANEAYYLIREFQCEETEAELRRIDAIAKAVLDGKYDAVLNVVTEQHDCRKN